MQKIKKKLNYVKKVKVKRGKEKNEKIKRVKKMKTRSADWKWYVIMTVIVTVRVTVTVVNRSDQSIMWTK